MNDYGKATQHLARTGHTWNHPGKPGKKPTRVPSAWTGDEGEWHDCMAELGFESCDDNRWCATAIPTPGAFGWCAIVALEADGFALHLTVDTEENEQDSPWIYPSARYATPLEAARVARAMFGGLTGRR